MINFNNLSTNQIIIYVNTLDIVNNPWLTDNYLFIFTNGFARQPVSVMPRIVKQTPRYTQFEVDLTLVVAQDPLNGDVALSPSGNWDYQLWAINAPSLDPSPGKLIDRGQMYLENEFQEIPDVTYISDNEDSQSIVYLTRTANECAVWSTYPDVWNLSTLVWNNCI